MFDLSFGKLAIIFTLCLLVLGPEKLPKLAAQLGRWTGQARAMARHFREQLEQEVAAEQFQKEKNDLEQTINSSFSAVKETIHSAVEPINIATQTVDQTVNDAIHPAVTSMGAVNDSLNESVDSPAKGSSHEFAVSETPVQATQSHQSVAPQAKSTVV